MMSAAQINAAITAIACIAFLAPVLACVGTTGGAIIDFPAAAAGPADITSPLVFTSDRGFVVTLTEASLHIGALYLDQSEPVSGAQNSACILPGTYVAEETSPLDVNLLSPTPQRFSTLAHGTTVQALVGQVWLTGGAIDTVADPTPILTLTGTATKAGTTMPFSGKITIGTNRQAQGVTLSGASPICKQRIVSPISVSLNVQTSGGLLLRIDPRILFVNVDFSQLQKASDTFAFSDDPTSDGYTQPSVNLYQNLRSSGPLYTFSWSPDL
jgi:hypothetical protein